MVQAGLLGRKSGRGFYVYDKGGRVEGAPESERHSSVGPSTAPTSDTPPAPPAAAPATRAPAHVAIVGEGPLAEDLMASAQTAGWVAQMGPPDADPGEVDLVVDLLMDLEAKARLWEALDRSLRPDAVRLTLALSASVTEIAASSRSQERLMGFATKSSPACGRARPRVRVRRLLSGPWARRPRLCATAPVASFRASSV